MTVAAGVATTARVGTGEGVGPGLAHAAASAAMPAATATRIERAGRRARCRPVGLRKSPVRIDEEVLEAVAIDADADLGVHRPALALHAAREAVAHRSPASRAAAGVDPNAVLRDIDEVRDREVR